MADIQILISGQQGCGKTLIKNHIASEIGDWMGRIMPDVQATLRERERDPRSGKARHDDQPRPVKVIIATTNEEVRLPRSIDVVDTILL